MCIMSASLTLALKSPYLDSVYYSQVGIIGNTISNCCKHLVKTTPAWFCLVIDTKNTHATLYGPLTPLYWLPTGQPCKCQTCTTSAPYWPPTGPHTRHRLPAPYYGPLTPLYWPPTGPHTRHRLPAPYYGPLTPLYCPPAGPHTRYGLPAPYYGPLTPPIGLQPASHTRRGLPAANAPYWPSTGHPYQIWATSALLWATNAPYWPPTGHPYQTRATSALLRATNALYWTPTGHPYNAWATSALLRATNASLLASNRPPIADMGYQRPTMGH